MSDTDEFGADLTPDHRKRMEERLAEIYSPESWTDLTPDERLHFQKEFEQLQIDFRELKHDFAAGLHQEVSELAGMHMPMMLRSPEEAEKYLESSDPSLRQAVLCVLFEHWRQRETYADRYERIAMCDPIAGVRMVALTLVGSCFSYTGDSRVSRLLGSVVLDCKEADNIRLIAYSNLLKVHGYPTEVGRMFVFKFPDHVNWNFVQRCCDAV
jgi:hypothetical protein